MSEYHQDNLITVSLTLPVSKLAAVYALLAGAASPAVLRGSTAAAAEGPKASAGNSASVAETPATETSPSVENAGTASTPAASASSENDGQRDAAGTLFDPARHTGTKVKSGLWRMKTGLSRGPNEGEDSPTYVNPNGGTPAPAAASSAAPSTAPAEDDEFAAFRAAATPAATTERSWTDADLSQLCNQAAIADGGPDRVKGIIAEFVPAGAQQHSRSIPAHQREAFAQKVEATFGIKYAG